MNLNPHQFADEVFDLVKTRSFKDLDYAKQEWILSFLTEDEYENMHRAHLLTDVQAELHNRESDIKADLLQRVEKLAPASTLSSSKTKNWIWQAASILLLFTTAWFGYKSMTPHIQVETKTVVSRDTIYLEKESKQAEEISQNNISKVSKSVEKIKRKSTKIHTPKHQPNNVVASKTETKPKDKVLYKNEAGVPVLSLDKIDNSSNKPKRNSKHHDPLEEQFKYVSL